MAKNKKPTRILYRDLANTLEMMSPTGAKKLIISLLKYEVGETALDYYQIGEEGAGEFSRLIDNIRENEEKYREKCNNRKNGANARWHKNDMCPNANFDATPSTYDIQPNKDFKEEKPVTTPQESEKPVEQPKNDQEMTIDCKPEITVDCRPEITQPRTDIYNQLANKMIKDPEVLSEYKMTKDEGCVTMNFLLKHNLSTTLQGQLRRTFKDKMKQTA